jgi:GTP pyrophosphokinase
VLVRLARCCDPLPGDDIEGYITRGRGVTVHSRDCATIFPLDPERRVPVSWESGKISARRVKVRVLSEDRPGILAAVTKEISGEGVNIEGGRITKAGQNRALQTFELGVKDRRHLDGVLKKLAKIRGVLSAERVRG